MTITCPACGKSDDGRAECARCGCDISILVKIIKAAGREFEAGRECLMNGCPGDAFSHAERSWLLKKSREAARLAFLAVIAQSRLDLADRWYARAMRQAA
jgi:hypothetical protein